MSRRKHNPDATQLSLFDIAPEQKTLHTPAEASDPIEDQEREKRDAIFAYARAREWRCVDQQILAASLRRDVHEEFNSEQRWRNFVARKDYSIICRLYDALVEYEGPLCADQTLMDLAEVVERHQFIDWGRKHHFPQFAGAFGSVGLGEFNWRYTLLHQTRDWVVAANQWLLAGKVQGRSEGEWDTQLFAKQRRSRGDLLLMLAEQHGYPELHVQVYGSDQTFAAGKESWQRLAQTCEMEVCEIALFHLADNKPSDEEIEALRTWLLAWGEAHRYPGFGFPFNSPPRNEDVDRRFGGINSGKERWLIETRSPYGKYGCSEIYKGEWLVKCVEQCKRFDSREQSIPWQSCSNEEVD